MKYIGNIGPKIDIQLFYLELDNKELTKEILDNSLTPINSNPYHSNYEDSLFSSKFGKISSLFIKKINEFALKENLKLVDIWSHIHKPLESTNTHSHTPTNLSFVYYVKVPSNCGQFIIDLSLSLNGPRIPISPVEGNLLIFPSWLPHMVTKNLSNDTRISISGNFKKIE